MSSEPKVMEKTCQGCGAKGQGKTGSVTGNTPPGWHSCGTTAGRWLWFCGTCTLAIGKAADKILKITKNNHLHFPSLVRMGAPDA